MIAGRRFRYFDTTIAVTSDDPALLDWLGEFLAPGFDQLAFARAGEDLLVEVRHDPKRWGDVAASRPAGELSTVPCFARDEKVTRRPAWEWQGRTVIDEHRLGALYVSTDAGVEVLPAPAAPRPRTAAMRVVRELAVAPALVDRHRVLLHASAVVRDGRGLLFAGPRTCGKSTMLAFAARAGGAAILANDRVMLTAEGDEWDARGVPTIVSLRRGTLDLLPDLGRRIPAVAAPVELTLAEAQAVPLASMTALAADLRVKVSPAQLAAALETTLAACAPLAAMAFPDQRGDVDAVTVERLTPPAALERLRGARFGVHAPIDEPIIFARASGTRPAGATDDALARLAASIPCFVVHVGAQKLGDAETVTRVFDAILR